MNKEEAIKYLSNNLKDWKECKPNYSPTEIVEEVDKDYQAIETILNLIEKQQKEIEETHNKLDKLDNADLTLVYMNGFYDGENKWKDKIKEKIEFYKRYGKVKNSNEYVMCEEIQVLEELLGE